MFLRLIMGMSACALIASQVFAAGRPAERVPLDGFLKSVAKTTGKSPELIRQEAAIALREKGPGLEREAQVIEKGLSEDYSLVHQVELMKNIQTSRRFRLNTGLESVRIKNLTKAGVKFNSLASTSKENDAGLAKHNLNLATVRLNAKLHETKLMRATLQSIENAHPGVKPEVLARSNSEYAVLWRDTFQELGAQTVAAQETFEVSVEKFLTLQGIAFEREAAQMNGGVKIPYEVANIRLIKLLKADRRFTKAVKGERRIAITSTKATEKSVYDAPDGTIYLGTDVLLKLAL